MAVTLWQRQKALEQAFHLLPPVKAQTGEVITVMWSLVTGPGHRGIKYVLTYLEVKLAALMLKNVAFDSAATALALEKKLPLLFVVKQGHRLFSFLKNFEAQCDVGKCSI